MAQADSLRAEGRVYGIDEGDSATLTQAYKTLESIPLPFREGLGLGSSYAHACYHYGRLLREKDNPVEAMQVFINATHSRTHDYHILGRVYSNMGSICHLAGDFSLSYDMYERSANVFLRDRDTLSYFYLLNDMAFELAEQGKKEEAFEVLNRVDAPPTEDYLVAKLWETKAEIYRIAAQYDSAIFCANQLEYLGYTEPAIILIKSQSYYELSIIDSALMYANMILNDYRASYQDRFNALYIITQYDSTLCSQDICDMASEREDIRYYEYEPVHEKCVKAVQLLEQDLNRKPNLAWLYAIIATLVVGGAITTMYISHKRKKHQLLSQQIDDLEYKNKVTIEQKKQQIVERCSIFVNSQNLKEDLCWNDYDKMCHVVNHHFGLLALKLQQTYHLSKREIRLCVLSLLNLGYDTMAEMLFYSPNGIGKFKLRVAQKLGTTAKNLQQFLITKAIDN